MLFGNNLTDFGPKSEIPVTISDINHNIYELTDQVNFS